MNCQQNTISIHAPLAGCDCSAMRAHTGSAIFQSTHPLRGATLTAARDRALRRISIHAPLAGCDMDGRRLDGRRVHFNPRTPCGVRPQTPSFFRHPPAFQSTHPLRGATNVSAAQGQVFSISIHAPLAGCDLFENAVYQLIDLFQSTHPLRGATTFVAGLTQGIPHFNPRTPCGVRPAAVRGTWRGTIFQSTHPLRGATRCHGRILTWIIISIHAPLAGCDNNDVPQECSAGHFNPRTPCGVRRGRQYRGSRKYHFNPRTPCGVRPSPVSASTTSTQFQSTHPLRGATIFSLQYFLLNMISIHAPLAGCDKPSAGNYRPCILFQSTHPLRGATGRTSVCGHNCSHFNPRTPCGVRLKYGILLIRVCSISIHAPLAGCDDTSAVLFSYLDTFQSTHPLRGATPTVTGHFPGTRISIHAPLAGCDRGNNFHLRLFYHFNPRTPCGVRPFPLIGKSIFFEFQSTHPLRGATTPK